MQPLEEEVDDGEVEEHRGEPDDGEPGGARTAPSSSRTSVDVPGKDDPDDEGPDFLRVPAPVATPGQRRPDCAEDEGEGPEDETDEVESFSRFSEPGRVCKNLRPSLPASRRA